MTKQSEIVLSGLPVSSGIALGKLFILRENDRLTIPRFSIEIEQVEGEIGRYRNAISSSKEDLKQLQSVLSDEGANEACTIIDTHIQMLDDPFITKTVEREIEKQLQNTESVFRAVIGEYEKQFNDRSDDFFKQRLIDVKDLSQRILKHLHPSIENKQALPQNAVIFLKELIPSHTAQASVSKVSAFLAEKGGETSHAALIARSKGIPFVANINEVDLEGHENASVIVDGSEGVVIVNPSESTLSTYRLKQKKLEDQYEILREKVSEKALTSDGVSIGLYANIESLEDMDTLSEKGAQGVGLFRSEFLFLHEDLYKLSEEEQYLIYIKILNKAKGLPVTFRVFDFGSDKSFKGANWQDEPNPALGLRAIRFLFKEKELFIRQLKALLRSSQYGKIELLFPFIVDLREFLAAKDILLEACQALDEEGVYYEKSIPLGVMIEVPSAAIMSDLLAKEVDFMSIGTNDLTQYLLAIDRGNAELNTTYKQAHPSLLRLIKFVVTNGNLENKQVHICGEMASSPFYTELLIGLGIKNFSCAPRHLPVIKNRLEQIDTEEAKAFVQTIENLPSGRAIEGVISKRLEKASKSQKACLQNHQG